MPDSVAAASDCDGGPSTPAKAEAGGTHRRHHNKKTKKPKTPKSEKKKQRHGKDKKEKKQKKKHKDDAKKQKGKRQKTPSHQHHHPSPGPGAAVAAGASAASSSSLSPSFSSSVAPSASSAAAGRADGLEELFRRSGVGTTRAARAGAAAAAAPTPSVSTAAGSSSSSSSSAAAAAASSSSSSSLLSSSGGATAPRMPRSPAAKQATLVAGFQRAQGKQELAKLRDTLKRQFTCALCRDLLYKPVTTPCGHSFCQACLLHMAATGGNLIDCGRGAVAVDETAYPDGGVLKDFKCPLCRTELPGFVAQAGVSVMLWDAVNAAFPGHAWQRRAEHEAELARARAVPTGAWASYYRQRLGGIMDNIEGRRDIHGTFDGDDDDDDDDAGEGGGGGGSRYDRRVVTEQPDGRVVVQDVKVNPHDRLRRHAVAFVRFPRRPPVAGQSFSAAVGLLDMDEEEADDGVPQMVVGGDDALLSNARDSIVMEFYKLHDLDPRGAHAAPDVAEVDSDTGQEAPPPLYETQRVPGKALAPTAVARAKPTTAPILEERRNVFGGTATFQDVRPATPGRYRLVFRGEPSKCSTHIDFDVLNRRQRSGPRGGDGSSSDGGDSAVRLSDQFSDEDEDEEDDEASDDSFVVADGEVVYDSDVSGDKDDEDRDTADGAGAVRHTRRPRRRAPPRSKASPFSAAKARGSRLRRGGGSGTDHGDGEEDEEGSDSEDGDVDHEQDGGGGGGGAAASIKRKASPGRRGGQSPAAARVPTTGAIRKRRRVIDSDDEDDDSD